MKPDTVLVDADILCYLSVDPNEEPEYVLRSVRLTLERIQEETECPHMRVFLSSDTNFRYGVDPNYKDHRPDDKPCHHKTIQNYLKKYHNAEVAPYGMEADDYIARIMRKERDKVVVASLDKDFLTVEGWHYKWRNHNAGEIFYVGGETAVAFLAYQLLVGDKADGIYSPLKKYKKDGTLGKTGFGNIAARDFLLEVDHSFMIDAVYDEYVKQGHEDKFQMNYDLLYIGQFDEEKTKAIADSRDEDADAEDAELPVSTVSEED